MWALKKMITAVVACLFTFEIAARAAPSPSQEASLPQRSLADVPSLHLQIMLKRKSMKIHGQSIFDVFAKPIVSDDKAAVRYDAFATFIEGDIEYTYILVDGVVYRVKTVRPGTESTSADTVRTVQCLPSITPLNSIVSALGRASSIPSSPVDDDRIDCKDGNLLEVSFGGVNFTLCASGASGFIAYGGDITMAVEYLPSPLKEISAPKVSASARPCAAVAKATTVTPTALALLTGESIPATSQEL